MADPRVLVGRETLRTVVRPAAVLRTVLSAGQGPAGPAGGELLRDYVAAQALGGHRAVALVAPGVVDYADVRNGAHCGLVVGITTGAVVAGALAEIRSFGQMAEPSWSWTPGEDVFLADDGLLSHLPSLGGATFVQRIGRAISPTEILVDLGEPVLLED